MKDSSHCSNSGQTNVLHGHVYSSSHFVISLKCAYINVCGFTLIVLIPDFLEFFSNYDICGIAQTKLDKFDDIQVPGFTTLCFNCDNALKSWRCGCLH